MNGIQKTVRFLFRKKSAIAQVDTGYLPVARFECDLMLYKTHLASLCLCRCL